MKAFRVARGHFPAFVVLVLSVLCTVIAPRTALASAPGGVAVLVDGGPAPAAEPVLTAMSESFPFQGATPNVRTSSAPSPVAPLTGPRGLAYDFLTGPQRKAYDAIEACLEDGSHTATVAGVSKEDFDEGYDAVRSDHPEHYWLRGYSTTTAGGKITFRADTRGLSAAQMAETGARVRAAAQGYLDSLPEGVTSYDKVKAAYEWLALYTRYGGAVEKGQDVTSALVGGRSVCRGYSAAFAYLCRLAGVPCTVVTGVAGGGPHAWNLVRIDGAYTYVDATWGDCASGTGDECTEYGIDYAYLCFTTKEMERTRTVESPAKLPDFDNRAFDYYALRGALLDKYDQGALVTVLESAVSKGQKSAEVKLDSPEEYQRACEALSSGDVKLSSVTGEKTWTLRNDDMCTIVIAW